MGFWDTDIRKVDNMSDMSDRREKFLSLLENLKSALDAVEKYQSELCVESFSDLDITHAIKYGLKFDVNEVIKKVDKAYWSDTIRTSGIDRVLTQKDVEKLLETYTSNPPPFCENTARDLVSRLASTGPETALATVKKVYEEIQTRTFRYGNNWREKPQSRNAAKIEKSFRFSHTSLDHCRYHEHSGMGIFNDLETACDLVNGELRKVYPHRIGDVIKKESGYSQDSGKFECEHFTVQFFKNGNVKIDFKSDETLKLLNMYGAEGSSKIPEFKKKV